MKELNILLVLFAFSHNCGIVHSKVLNIIADFLSHTNSDYFQSLLHPPTFTELAFQYGHQAETHEVITEDGYVLTLFRLRGNRTALPVLLHHGALDSSDTWIIRGDSSLSITLAKRNYDVWLANARGNKYSKHHLFLDANTDPAYWNFSFDEHGLYDLPANIDYILNKTGAEKLNVIGHSQGNTMIWVLLSTRTEYNSKINVATALAPICYLQYALPPFTTLLHALSVAYPVLRELGVTSILGDKSALTIAFRLIGQIPILGYLIDAYDILFEFFGLDSTELEPTFLPVVALHVPTATSLKNFEHFAQLVQSGQFASYDYGEEGNLVAYNSTRPIVYALGNIKAKVVILAALNDKISQIADVNRLRSALPNVVRFVINPYIVMNHIDYTWGRTAKNYLYNYIFDALENYN